MKDGFSLRGNHRAESLLKALSRQGHAHAILIEGPGGSGKSSFARRFAMTVLCRGEKDRPCLECISCRKVIGGNHPDLHIYEGEKKPGGFHVDTVRGARAQAFVLPNESDRKVLLLEDCETMTQHGQNALLTILEDPPPSAVFILTAKGRQELLPTILSRVNVIGLELLSHSLCEEVLAELLPQSSPEERKAAARRANGSVGAASAFISGKDDSANEADALFAHIAKGEEMAALIIMKKYEKDRAGLMDLLESLKSYISQLVPEGDFRHGNAIITRRELYELCEITDDAILAARSNVGGLLLGGSFCAKMAQALQE